MSSDIAWVVEEAFMYLDKHDGIIWDVRSLLTSRLHKQLDICNFDAFINFFLDFDYAFFFENFRKLFASFVLLVNKFVKLRL